MNLSVSTFPPNAVFRTKSSRLMNRAVAICYLYLRDPREGVSIGAVDAVDHPEGKSLF
jgi:hypothetical protein